MKLKLIALGLLINFCALAQKKDQLLQEQLDILVNAPNGWVMTSFLTFEKAEAREDIAELSPCVRSYVIRFNKNGTYTEIPTKTNCPDQIIEKSSGKWSYKSFQEGWGMTYITMDDDKIKHNFKRLYVIRISSVGMVLSEAGGTDWPNHVMKKKKK